MKHSSLRKKVVAAMGLIMLAGCGGGGGANLSGGGVTGTGVSSGPITGFGSIFVNGVQYDLSGADITVNGVPATEAELKVGMIVKLRGERSGATGSAVEVEFDSDVKGMVHSVDAASSRLVVMGQTVLVDNLTVFAGATLATLAAGNVVEVSGWRDANDSIHATRIEYEQASFTPGDITLEVDGTVASLDTTARTFRLGSLTVSYGGLNVTLGTGQRVEVKSNQGMNGANQLVASTIDADDSGLDVAEGDDVELQGLVSSVSEDSFAVNGHTVRISGDTEFENGAFADILVGVRVEVEGTINAAGELSAQKISLRPESEIELEGNVEAVNTTAKTVTVLGQTFSVDALTQMEDERDDDRYFNINDINAGDRLEVNVFRSGMTMNAARIKRVHASSEESLQGNVESVNGSTIVILGTQIDVSSVDWVTVGVAGPSVLSGRLVEVEGTMQNGIFVATSVDIEDKDEGGAD